jgi:hypothetical protein
MLSAKENNVRVMELLMEAKADLTYADDVSLFSTRELRFWAAVQ